jgi:hypothetical protein
MSFTVRPLVSFYRDCVELAPRSSANSTNQELRKLPNSRHRPGSVRGRAPESDDRLRPFRAATRLVAALGDSRTGTNGARRPWSSPPRPSHPPGATWRRVAPSPLGGSVTLRLLRRTVNREHTVVARGGGRGERHAPCRVVGGNGVGSRQRGLRLRLASVCDAPPRSWGDADHYDDHHAPATFDHHYVSTDHDDHNRASGNHRPGPCASAFHDHHLRCRLLHRV